MCRVRIVGSEICYAQTERRNPSETHAEYELLLLGDSVAMMLAAL